jgi:beta-xylosidase
LVNWKIVGHALNRLWPFDHFSAVQHGGGVWAPAIRYHNGEFYIYYPDPDFGIYLTKAKNISGPWTDPVMVEAGKGLIDPCPLWDDNGKVYLVHAFAGSRSGIKSILVVKELNATADKVTGNTVMVYDGHDQDPTIEGPKLYKRNGYYYIFAPAGGVGTGWQTVLRSKNIYGPYERKVAMDQGSTAINGPHQGAWVQTQTGEDWFIHFQDKDAYGRVVHLQPMKWQDDWPVIGADKKNTGKGEPVIICKKPNVGKSFPVSSPQDGDEFNETKIGLQWQWQANPKTGWAFATPAGSLRMYTVFQPDTIKTVLNLPNILAQKFPAETFMATAKLSFKPKLEGDKFGLIVLGYDFAYISVINKNGGNYISMSTCKEADKGNSEKVLPVEKISNTDIYLRVNISNNAICNFSYSEDGKNFKAIGEKFNAKPGRWVGAKIGLFSSGTVKTNDSGYADIDWFRIEKPE